MPRILRIGNNPMPRLFKGFGMIRHGQTAYLTYYSTRNRYTVRVPWGETLRRRLTIILAVLALTFACAWLLARNEVNTQAEQIVTAETQNQRLQRQLDEAHEQIQWVRQSDKYQFSGPGEIQAIIQRSARLHGVNPQKALEIAECESGYNPKAKNKNSTAVGTFQWLESTWEWIGSPGDRLNAYDNITAFMVYYPKYPEWWAECDN